VLSVKAAMLIYKPRPVQFLWEQTQWAETARYLGMILDTWSALLNKVGKKSPQRRGVPASFLNTRSCLSVGNGMLLYKQLIRPMMDYECPIWSSAACSHVRKLQVLQSKCLGIATRATWYVRPKVR
jgi:hypothetical protein